MDKARIPVVGGPIGGRTVLFEMVVGQIARFPVRTIRHAIQVWNQGLKPHEVAQEVAAYRLEQVKIAWGCASFECLALVYEGTQAAEVERSVLAAFVAQALHDGLGTVR